MGFRGRQMKKKAIKKLITLNQIKAKEPCSDEWEKLLKYSQNIGRKINDKFDITDIIKSNTIKDAIWAIRALEGFEEEKRLFEGDAADAITRYTSKYSAGAIANSVIWLKIEKSFLMHFK